MLRVVVTMLVPILIGCASTRTSSESTLPVFDVQGHRGARGLLPENTIPAFLKALELGVTTLELDTVVAGDSTVVVSHEPWMSAEICSLPSGEPVPADEERQHAIYRMAYEEVAQYDCGSRGNARFPDQRSLAVHKPRLIDVIQMAEAYAAEHGLPPVSYNIETKIRPDWEEEGLTPDPATFTRLLYDVLDDTGVTARASLQSFDVRTLQAGRALDSDWTLVLLVAREFDRGVDGNLDVLGFVPDVYSPDYRLVDAELVEAVHARGMRLIPWTVNDLQTMRDLQALGVDGLITDYPDRGVTLLQP